MLRASAWIRRGGSGLWGTSFAFDYPRFSTATHLIDMSLPELKDCKALYQEDKVANAGKCLSLLDRAHEIFKNIPNWEQNESMTNVVRSITASKVELMSLLQVRPLSDRGVNGLLPPPMTTRAQSTQVNDWIVREIRTTALRSTEDAWTRSDVEQLDTSCFLMGKFVESFCLLHPRRDPGSLAADRLVSGQDKELAMLALTKLQELHKLAELASEKHGATHKSLRWLPIKLLLLQAICTIPATGNLEVSRKLIQQAGLQVEEWGSKKTLVADVSQEPELGLLMLFEAEIASRVYNWMHFPKEVIDEGVVLLYQKACSFFSTKFDTAINHDAVMDGSVGSRPNAFKLDEASAAVRDYNLRDYYSTCLHSYGNFLLSAPRADPTKAIFPKGETFTRNPLLNVASGSDMIFDDCKRPIALSIDTCRKNSQQALDRALQINRLLLPEDRNNEKAAWMLLSMACGFGDLRDYLYATGLLSSASTAFLERYGETSEEMLFLLRLEERLLNGMGSAKESETRKTKIHSILAERATYAK